jgi:isoamylase
MSTATACDAGHPEPLGAYLRNGGVQFALFSRHATAVSVVLFPSPEAAEPDRELPLNPKLHKTGDIWHIFVPGIGAGQHYLFRVDGPYEPEHGHRYNRHKLVLDPYARALDGRYPDLVGPLLGYDADSPDLDLTFSDMPNTACMPRCIVVEDEFAWDGDRPLNYPLKDSIIYETHVRGFTIHPSAEVSSPGTYQGIIEKIPYLSQLGITSLELLPVNEFNHKANRRRNPHTRERLTDYWGYNTVAFFAPKASYSSFTRPGCQVVEFKEMVKALHSAGIEIILDVVFNHTAEGNELGPTYSFRGLDNSIYYLLSDNKRFYRNYTGCGNTVSCGHPVMQQFIMDCLHYWVVEMHVDGFRFDLGSVLSRDRDGRLVDDPPLLERIAEDPVLRDTKIIAEAWDAAGAYQVGGFPGGRWAEWNDKFRDDVRSFWLRDSGDIAGLATRISGSADLYMHDGRKPFHSINFVTSHDGFTMKDLVSYSRKHNEENGEGNRDGHNENYSNNHGVEGDTPLPQIRKIRNRQVRNLLVTLLLSTGTPMMLGGDEFYRTQKGNNNAYCQDNELSWFDYGLAQSNKELLEFTTRLIRFRRHHPSFRRPDFFTGRDKDKDSIADITWYNENARPVDWSRATGLLAIRIDGHRAETGAVRDDDDFLVLINGARMDAEFVLPAPNSGTLWRRVIDTSLRPPDDIVPNESDATRVNHHKKYTVTGKSMVVLISH